MATKVRAATFPMPARRSANISICKSGKDQVRTSQLHGQLPPDVAEIVGSARVSVALQRRVSSACERKGGSTRFPAMASCGAD